jgi:CDP-diacylglycerol--serine O-phosphatidyltransferase
MASEQSSGRSRGRKPGTPRKRRRRRDTGSRPRFKRGIYLLPGFFTVSNLFFGFLAIISTMHCLARPGGNGPGIWSLSLSALFIGIAALLDALDGRVARLANATSQFGVEFDSLADIVSFGMAPSLLIYVWGLQSLGRVGWLTAFIFLVCCAARLARFNIRVDSGATDPRFFIGLPTPAAACFLAALVYILPEPVADRRFAVALMLVGFTISYLMVSNFKYASFKNLSLKSRRPYIFVVLVGLVLVAVAAAPQPVLLGLALAYVLSGPLRRLGRLSWSRRRKAGEAEAADRPEETEATIAPGSTKTPGKGRE